MTDNNKEEDLYESSDISIGFETTERNKTLEAANYAYSHSTMGVFNDFIDRYLVQLWQIVRRFAVFIHCSIKKNGLFIIKGIYFFVLFIYNEYCNKKYHERINTVKTKDNNKSTENTKVKTDKNKFFSWAKAWRGIIGIVMLLVIISIAYVSYTVNTAIEDTALRIMTVPMSIWAAVQLVKQFIKQGEK